MVEQKLCRLCLPRTTLSTDDDGLVLPLIQHGVVSIVGSGKYVRRKLTAFSTTDRRCGLNSALQATAPYKITESQD